MFSSLKLISILILTSLMASPATAAFFPRGCEVSGFAYRDHYLILNLMGGQTFYLIQNRSNKPIELERYETRDVFMSPKLKSKLSPSRWAAFASDIENLHFKCYTYDDDNNTDLVNCSDVLEICQYPRVKFALSNMGNYWVSTNKSQQRVIKDAISKGILLRW